MARKAFSELTVLITGASTGIGYDAAVELGRLGMHVLAGARKESDLARLHELDNVTPVRLDVTKSEDIKQVVQTLEELGRGLDVLINNAGVAVGAPLMDLNLDDLRWQFEVNVFAVAALTRACFPLLQPNKGRIINISSLSGRMAIPFMGPYAMSKFAIEAYSDALRRELSPFGMEVVVIQPGPIQTAIWDKTDPNTDQFAGSLFEERAKRAGVAVIANGKNKSLPVKHVTHVLVQAIQAKRPKTRYVITKGKWLRILLSNLPDRWTDAILNRVFR